MDKTTKEKLSEADKKNDANIDANIENFIQNLGKKSPETKQNMASMIRKSTTPRISPKANPENKISINEEVNIVVAATNASKFEEKEIPRQNGEGRSSCETEGLNYYAVNTVIRVGDRISSTAEGLEEALKLSLTGKCLDWDALLKIPYYVEQWDNWKTACRDAHGTVKKIVTVEDENLCRCDFGLFSNNNIFVVGTKGGHSIQFHRSLLRFY